MIIILLLRTPIKTLEQISFVMFVFLEFSSKDLLDKGLLYLFQYWLCVLTLLGSGIFFAVINLYWKKGKNSLCFEREHNRNQRLISKETNCILNQITSMYLTKRVGRFWLNLKITYYVSSLHLFSSRYAQLLRRLYVYCMLRQGVSCLPLTLVIVFSFPVLTIFGTSVYGGAVIATSLDYFFERMMMLKWVSKAWIH